MMQTIKLFIIIPFLLFTNTLVFSQKGTIRGSVFDGKNGESLPGVTIFIESNGMGTTTDLDGKFSLSLNPGTYDVRISYISYETITISDLVVEADKVTLLENLKLNEVSIQLSETVITATAIRNTESALLTMKHKSANVIDGISSVGLRKIGDSDVASSMKRVTGVSVEGGKYVFVRGLGDRYTKTILNGLDIPGLDPDRNTLQMDIFPTNIIENLVVNKSFSADLPADFTGGVINISIKEFPEIKNYSLSLSAGYNNGSHFNNNYLSYEGGKTDWLGFDDGTRKIPATENIPFFVDVISQSDPINSETGQRFGSILNSFSPTMAAEKQKSLMDYNIGASFGNQFEAGKFTLGYIFALSYKNNTDFYENAVYSRYGLDSDADVTELERREYQIGNYGVNNVLVSGLAGFALKTKNSKYRVNLLRLQNGESQAGIFDYDKSNLGTTFSGFQHTLQYSQRELTNILIDGKYSSPATNWDIEWKISPTLSVLSDPDIRFIRYKFEDGAYSIGTEVGFPQRIWRDLKEINLAGLLHFTKNFKAGDEEVKIKFGGALTYKNRDYNIRSFAINIRNVPLTGDPNEIFSENNLWPYHGNPFQGTTYEASFIPDNPNKFESNVNNTAAYASVEFNAIKKLKTIAGLRIENYLQRYTGQDQLGENILDNDIVIDKLDFFPTINIIYGISDQQNLRFSYAKTIARPSFKELSYSQIFDPISGRTFIGGLFKDENLFTGEVFWNGNLVSTDIHNFDLRWEYFQMNGQAFSLSAFYKSFINPIELVQYARVPGSFQPRNVGNGKVYGVEIEARQNLNLFGSALKNISFNLNLTLIKSEIELSNIEYTSRLNTVRTGQVIGKERDMAGQAPYIINAGFAYSGGENGFWKNLEAGVYYNVQGETLQYVGISDRPDVYSKPFHSLNFNANKNLGAEGRFQIGLKIENILNQNKESVYKSFMSKDQFYSSLHPGITYQIRMSYSF